MHYVLLPLLGFIAAALHIYLLKLDRNPKTVLETIIAYAFVFSLGASCIYAFMGHAFAAKQVAEYIGWAPGSPFQFEVAVANLAFGVLGVLCFWFRGRFWLATIIGFSVFGFGAAYGHVVDMQQNHNYAPGNAGAPLYSDIIKPLVFFALYFAHSRVSRNQAGPRALVGEISPPD